MCPRKPGSKPLSRFHVDAGEGSAHNQAPVSTFPLSGWQSMPGYGRNNSIPSAWHTAHVCEHVVFSLPSRALSKLQRGGPAPALSARDCLVKCILKMSLPSQGVLSKQQAR